jgi:hypothetical protein
MTTGASWPPKISDCVMHIEMGSWDQADACLEESVVFLRRLLRVAPAQNKRTDLVRDTLIALQEAQSRLKRHPELALMSARSALRLWEQRPTLHIP